MGIFNDDRATFNEQAAAIDAELSKIGFDGVLQKAFESGMDIDQIMYLVFTHTERTVRRYIVQDQLKRVANKEK